MRIDRIEIRNFKRFEEKQLDLNPKFTLLAGDNGAGKTTLLDALAVAAGVWLVKPPDSTLVNSGRNILRGEIRLESKFEGDRVQLFERKPVSIMADGEIANERVKWLRQVRRDGVRTSNADAKDALHIIENHFSQVDDGDKVLSPVIAYYGAGRAWLPSRSRSSKAKTKSGPARRWEAFYDCFEERIRLSDLQNWFQRETIAFAGKREWRPGYKVVKNAILRCVPGANGLWYDGDRAEIVLSIDEQAHTFTNLSAGQKMMVALIADISIKVVSQNAHLLREDLPNTIDEFPHEILKKTPGLVLIDELDAHLHPLWQQRVVSDLKQAFPMIQFVCTSHSPFVIQSLDANELRTLDESGPLLVEYANRSIEDIAEDIQKVEMPQQSLRAKELAQATEKYFSLLKKSGGKATSSELKKAEAAYRAASERYTGSPGLDAILKLEAMAQQTEESQ